MRRNDLFATINFGVGSDGRAVACGLLIALFGVKLVWLPGSAINLLVNCAGVRQYTPDVYSKIFLALIPTFNGWSSLLCIAVGGGVTAYLAKRPKIKRVIVLMALSVVSYALLAALAVYLRPYVH